MKKLLLSLLCLGICFGMAGCGESSNPGNNADTSENEQTSSTISDQSDFFDTYPEISDIVIEKNLTFKSALAVKNIEADSEAGLTFLMAYESNNELCVEYIFNKDISYIGRYDLTTKHLNSIQVSDKSGTKNEDTLMVAMVSILDEFDSLTEEDFGSLGSALRNPKPDIYTCANDNFTVSTTKTDNLASWEIQVN